MTKLKGKALAEYRRYQVEKAGFIPVEYDAVTGEWLPTEKLDFWKAKCPHCRAKYSYNRIEWMIDHLIVGHGMVESEALELFAVTVGGR